MTLRLKNILYTLGLFSAMFLVWHYRQNVKQDVIWVKGKTMGPITYNVKYFDESKRNLKPQIDSLLVVFNESLNTYIPDSEISKFNKTDSFRFELPYFLPALEAARTIYDQTNGAFDPSIGPLINAWGFGPGEQVGPDSSYVDSLRQFVGYDKIKFDQQSVVKNDSRTTISFSASAKGYGVDVVANYLSNIGIENYYVEIGGEVVVSGKNLERDSPWIIGILDPDSDEISQFAYAQVALENRAMATSGNYFNYHIIDGVKYGHTISPSTGYPIQHNLLSASVFAEDCQTADALATAFMVMGKDGTIEFLKQHTQYDAYLIFSQPDGTHGDYSTEGIKPFIKRAE
ncbi:FAD:protein FMN transferase [Fulvivirga lutimaris]|uniref:FAD:protein FMN transferase n=1 Tax=Fulvivirga lutimaris TaxID=1819566 RepID=UPI0012BCD8AE|nr:FAD:protein FMN transferase [Fulvivirga lutimaris]MTI40971.1 FAD:protein FMN transferase [Fulvivirga lutimaris]